MAIIEPVRKDVVHPQQIKKNSATLRIWHWTNLIIISGSLLTVLANSTITNQHTTSPLIKESIQKAGATVTNAQAKSAADALKDSVWDIHVYFGYCLAGLLLFRLILEFFQLADQKFIRKIKSAHMQFSKTKKNREAATHELTVKIIYALFYMLLTVMVLTGLSLAFEDVAFFKPLRHTIIRIHNLGMYLVLAFIVVHLGGVFLAEFRKDGKGIVSDMINGGREEH